MTQLFKRVDQTALRFNQACIILLLLLGFLTDQVWLVALVAAVMLIGTWWPSAGLFKLIYARLLKPAGWLKPQIVPDEQAPHLFAQGLGGIFLVLSLLAFLLGSAVIGWALAIIVVILAGVNLFAGFCVGCFIFYQLARRGIRPSLPGWQGI